MEVGTAVRLTPKDNRNNKGAHQQPQEKKEPPKVTPGEPNLLPSIIRFTSFSLPVKTTDSVGGIILP